MLCSSHCPSFLSAKMRPPPTHASRRTPEPPRASQGRRGPPQRQQIVPAGEPTCMAVHLTSTADVCQRLDANAWCPAFQAPPSLASARLIVTLPPTVHISVTRDHRPSSMAHVRLAVSPRALPAAAHACGGVGGAHGVWDGGALPGFDDEGLAGALRGGGDQSGRPCGEKGGGAVRDMTHGGA